MGAKARQEHDCAGLFCPPYWKGPTNPAHRFCENAQFTQQMAQGRAFYPIGASFTGQCRPPRSRLIKDGHAGSGTGIGIVDGRTTVCWKVYSHREKTICPSTLTTY
jgi:hypothetical protein